MSIFQWPKLCIDQEKQSNTSMDQQAEALPPFIHINENDFSYRKHKKQKEEDIVICECKYDANNADSACGERCLNVLTSTECTTGYCPCGFYCRNQRFQKCEYAKTKLFRTEGRGWGLLADENIKAGRFIIEYCGEVISSGEARRRSESYETQGLRDAYIITLDANESIDATRKGSLARFINHSCQPNCETRKWTVLGEVRVGIFAKQDIAIGTELAYDYNFEWYGGAKVRCLCGSGSCSGFLGAKSRGFQEDTYLWEDDDDRYSVEKVPLYDSAEDEPSFKLLKTMESLKTVFTSDTRNGDSAVMDVSTGSVHQLESPTLLLNPPVSVAMEGVAMEGAVVSAIKTEVSEERKLFSQDTGQGFPQTNAMISRIRSNSACRNYQIGPGPPSKKRLKPFSNGRSKIMTQKKVDAKLVAQSLASKEAQDEIFKCEEMKTYATSQLDSLYNEIRPAIEEHERDTQDSVPTSVAEKWIEASCIKLKAEFDLHFSIIKNIAFTPPKAPSQTTFPEGDNKNEVKYLTG